MTAGGSPVGRDDAVAVSTEEPAPPGSGGGLRERALRGVLWAALEKWLVRISTLVGFIVLGNVLSPAQFGVVALAMTFITILTIVADAGFSSYLVQVQRLTPTVTSTAFHVSGLLGLVLAAGLVAGSGPISTALDAPALQPVLAALAAALLIAGLSSVPTALLQRELKFRELAVRQVLATALSVVAAIALALAGAGVWALVAQTLVRSTVAAIVLWLTTDFRPRWSFSRSDARAMSVFGVKSMFVKLGTQLRDQGEVFLIGVLAGTTALGYWTVAGRIAGVIAGLCITAVGAVAQPVFARLQGDSARLARGLSTASAMGGLILVPVLVALALTSREVVPAVFGSQWAPAAGVAAILAIRTLVSSLADFSRSALMATGHPGAELAVTTGLLVVQLALVLLFAGGDLLLLAGLLTVWMVISWPVRALVVRRLLGVPMRTYTQVCMIILAGAIAAAGVFGVQLLAHLSGLAHVALVTLLGGAIYLGVVWLLCRPLVRDVGRTLASVLRRRRARSA